VSLRDQLQAIHDEHGRLTPELVVEAARAESHPLHDRVFDRPVGEAAESWYRHRAHELIQSVKVVYKEATETTPERSIRAFHAVRSEDGYSYEPAENIADDPLIRAMVLRDMEREWKALHRRFGEFSEFLSMVRNDLEAAA
jgi:hypothetical protein